MWKEAERLASLKCPIRKGRGIAVVVLTLVHCSCQASAATSARACRCRRPDHAPAAPPEVREAESLLIGHGLGLLRLPNACTPLRTLLPPNASQVSTTNPGAICHLPSSIEWAVSGERPIEASRPPHYLYIMEPILVVQVGQAKMPKSGASATKETSCCSSPHRLRYFRHPRPADPRHGVERGRGRAFPLHFE